MGSDHVYPLGEKFVVDYYISGTCSTGKAYRLLETLINTLTFVRTYDRSYKRQQLILLKTWHDRIWNAIELGYIDNKTDDDLRIFLPSEMHPKRDKKVRMDFLRDQLHRLISENAGLII